jgi:hypothetical protein
MLAGNRRSGGRRIAPWAYWFAAIGGTGLLLAALLAHGLTHAYGKVTNTFAVRRPVQSTGGRLDVELDATSGKSRTLSEAVPFDEQGYRRDGHSGLASSNGCLVEPHAARMAYRHPRRSMAGSATIDLAARATVRHGQNIVLARSGHEMNPPAERSSQPVAGQQATTVSAIESVVAASPPGAFASVPVGSLDMVSPCPDTGQGLWSCLGRARTVGTIGPVSASGDRRQWEQAHR